MSPVRYKIRGHGQRDPIIYPALFYFGDNQRRILEIGPGRGDFLIHLATKNPHDKIIAIEVKPKRYHKLIKRIEKQNLTNVRLIESDARVSIAELFEPKSMDEIHIQFPDPWPKHKHGKNRLVNEGFLINASRVLKNGGKIYFTTDFKDYALSVSTLFQKNPDFVSCQKDPIEMESEEAFRSFFYEKWKKCGREIYYQKYTLNAQSNS